MQRVNSRSILLVVLFILILVVVALLMGRVSYSFLAPGLEGDNISGSTVTSSGDALIFKHIDTLTLDANVENFGVSLGNIDNKISTSATLIAKQSKKNEEINAKTNYNVGFSLGSNSFQYTTLDNTPELILTIRDESKEIVNKPIEGLSFVNDVAGKGISGYDITGKMGTFIVDDKHVITTNDSVNGTTQDWTFTLTFINLDSDQSLNQSSSVALDVILKKDAIDIGKSEILEG